MGIEKEERRVERENEIKKIEEKLNYISGIYSRAGIYFSIDVREKTNIFILLVAVIYLDYSKTNLKEILKKINSICDIETSKLEDIFKIYELENKSNKAEIYADIMNTIMSFKDIGRYALINYILENRFR